MSTIPRLTTILALTATFPAAAAELTPPAEEGRPVEVNLGLLVYDFARITARDESFDLTAYLEMSWRDPRLADDAAPPIRRFSLDEVWSPRLYFENAAEQPRPHADPVVEVDPQGNASKWVIISGKFTARMDLRRFPFDRQVLSIRMGAFEDESQVKLVADPELMHLSDEAFATDWAVSDPKAVVDSRRYQPSRETYSRYTFRVTAERQATFYIWRVLLPLTLLVAISWAVFWFEPVGLQPQISTCTACLIALVAFDFAIDFSLPKVAYLTLVDRHALIGFAFVAAAVGVVVLVHLAVKRNRLDQALAIQRGARRVIPAAYLIAAAANLNVMLARWAT
jgi:hypothetical protein